MTQIAALTTDERLLEMLRASGLKVARIDAVDFATYWKVDHPPSAIVIDLRTNGQLPPGVSEYRRAHPAGAIMLVLKHLEPQMMLEAMRAGVNECLTEPLNPQQLEDTLRRVVMGLNPDPPGQLFAFVGAKGGVGTTTLAVNTAAALARLTKEPTLLGDLHLVHGDAALFFAAEPRFSIVDALENVHRVDESFFSGLVEKTKVGVHVLASSNRTIHGSVDPERTRTLLDFATKKYRYTVLDVPRSDFSMLDALDPATSIVVVTNQEVSALRSAFHTAETLRQRYGAQRVRVVINRFDSRSVVGTAEIERVIGEPVAHLLPSDYRVAVEAANTGQPLVLDKEGKLSRSIRDLASDLAGLAKEKPAEPSGVLARLAWRRA